MLQFVQDTEYEYPVLCAKPDQNTEYTIVETVYGDFSISVDSLHRKGTLVSGDRPKLLSDAFAVCNNYEENRQAILREAEFYRQTTDVFVLSAKLSS